MSHDELLDQFTRYDQALRSFGGPDESALRDVRQIVFALRHQATGDYYAVEKIGGMLEWAEIGLSTRKFQRYGGFEKVRVIAMSEANSAKSVLIRALENR